MKPAKKNESRKRWFRALLSGLFVLLLALALFLPFVSRWSFNEPHAHESKDGSHKHFHKHDSTNSHEHTHLFRVSNGHSHVHHHSHNHPGVHKLKDGNAIEFGHRHEENRHTLSYIVQCSQESKALTLKFFQVDSRTKNPQPLDIDKEVLLGKVHLGNQIIDKIQFDRFEDGYKSAQLDLLAEQPLAKTLVIKDVEVASKSYDVRIPFNSISHQPKR